MSWVVGEPDATLTEASQDRDKDVCTAPSQEEPRSHDLLVTGRILLVEVVASAWERGGGLPTLAGDVAASGSETMRA